MKKIVLTLSLFLCFESQAQMTSYDQDVAPINKKTITAKPASGNSISRAAPFYTEDFGSGFPAGWSIQDTSGICPWKYSTDGSWGFFNGNSATAGAAGINSTTASNGFLICDIDSANHFTYGQPSSTNYQFLSSYLTSGAIDCSSHPSVVLNFQQFFRFNNSVSMNVRVSNDSINWTTFNVSGGIANNATSQNPTSVNLNITAVAANQPTVYIQFGWSARVYYWMIDDITLSEQDPFDITNNDTWWTMGTLNNQYYKIPIAHAVPITFQTSLTNNSVSTLTGSSVSITVDNASGTVFSGSSAPINLAVATTDTVLVTTTWTPATVGNFTISSVASTTAGSDGNLTNNTFQDSIRITPSVMSFDNLTSGNQSTGGISNWSSNTGSEFKIGNVYQSMIDDFIQCVQIGIANNQQNVDKEMFGQVYVYDDASASYLLRGATEVYRIAASDLGTIISLPLTVNTEVFANEQILVVACHFGGATNGSEDVFFMFGQSVPTRTVYGFNASGGLLFLTNPRSIVVRPDFNCGNNLGSEEMHNTFNAHVFPNPAKDQLTISLKSSLHVGTIALSDLNGRIVLSKEVNSLSTEILINVANIESGIYTLKINSEKGTKAIQVAIVH